MNDFAAKAFKTRWFSRAARKARVSDAALAKAIAQLLKGQADDLGGGVYKKRLGENRYRSIILAKGNNCWVFEFLFAKQDMANIDESELKAFRQVASLYQQLEAKQIEALVAQGHWIEIGILD